MGSDSKVRLNCLLFSSPLDKLETLIRGCAQTHTPPILLHENDPAKLASVLASQRIDIVILAIADDQDTLPTCLSQFPDIPVVVVAPTNNKVPLPTWIERGASDVLERDCDQRLTRAISGILRECSVRRELANTRQQLNDQTTLRKMLFNTHDHAVMLWYKSEVYQSNKQFERFINCTQPASLSMQWQRWMSAETAHLLDDKQAPNSLQTIITGVDASQYKASIDTVMLEGGLARLVQIDPQAVKKSDSQAVNTDSISGLPTRQTFTKNLQVWLRALKPHTRFVAIYIKLPTLRSQSGSQGIDETLQDLSVYRAGILLEQNSGQATVLGRSGHQSLLLVQLQNKNDARSSALSIRALLGTLGGLIDNPNDISIKTLTSSASAMGAYEVIWRLESSQPVAGRMRPVDQSQTLMNRRTLKPIDIDFSVNSAVTPQPEALRFAHPTAGA